ncbi:MAG: hypothetical protein Q8M02_10480 [Candidatus Didemnitutus sp.]|nr:hypothetical protein [Candidatus Didemnitutus sp.]
MGEKLSEQILVRVAASDMERIQAVCARRKTRPTQLAREGLFETLARYEVSAPAVDAETAELVSQAKSMGLNIAEMIRAALRSAA